MEIEQKQTEGASTETKVEQTQTTERTITVDIYGTALELPMSKAKEIIAKRDEKTKGYNELKAKIESAEKKASDESSRAALLEMMRKQDVTAVEEAVAAKYKDTIQKFESKVFTSEIKAALAKNGILPDAIADATKLIMGEVKAELSGDDVTLAGKKVDDFVAEWAKNKTHLQAVKATDKKPMVRATTPANKPLANPLINIAAGLSKFNK